MTSGDGAPAPSAKDAELATKLALIRAAMDRAGVAAVRLRQHDWFAWATCGGANAVLLASETGVAEVLITSDEAWILADTIEADRLAEEELLTGFRVHAPGWAQLAERRPSPPMRQPRESSPPTGPPARRCRSRTRWRLRSVASFRLRSSGTGPSDGAPPRR